MSALFRAWISFNDVIVFANNLPSSLKFSFLVVLYVIFWEFWNHRNSMIFNQVGPMSMRNIICQIISLLNHWTGGIGDAVKKAVSFVAASGFRLDSTSNGGALASSDNVLMYFEVLVMLMFELNVGCIGCERSCIMFAC
jgi:hypothetical protein